MHLAVICRIALAARKRFVRRPRRLRRHREQHHGEQQRRYPSHGAQTRDRGRDKEILVKGMFVSSNLQVSHRTLSVF